MGMSAAEIERRKIETLAEDTINELRRISRDLRPAEMARTAQVQANGVDAEFKRDMAIGHTLAWGVCKTLDTEMYRIPYRIGLHTDGFALLVVVVAAVISGLVVRRKLDTLDLVAVLRQVQHR